MKDEELRRLCAATVAVTSDPVLRDLCQTALDLLSRNYELMAALQEQKQLAVQGLLDMDARGTDVPPRRKPAKKKRKLSEKRLAYMRDYQKRKREADKLRKLEQQVSADIQEQVGG